ncbi:chemotaxis protein CheD [bacterium]|nr:chemotaxis protein CheD [bacterium]
MALTKFGPALTQIVVDLADMKTSNNTAAVIGTGGLGAGMGLTIYDPELHVGGVLHFMLPNSMLNRQKALANPYIFADTGIPMLFRRTYKLGAVKERLVCKAAGGGETINGGFNVGSENIDAIHKILAANGVKLAGECFGGTASMSICLNLSNGQVRAVKSNGEEVTL